MNTARTLGGPRGRWIAVLFLVAGAVLLLLAGSQAWAVQSPALSTGHSGDTTVVAVTRTLGWVALGGVAAVLASTGWMRRLVGALLLLFGLAAFLLVLTEGEDAALHAGNLWSWLAVIGTALVVVGAALTVSFGHRWQAMSRRYDRSATATSSTPLDMWQAIDRGQDPTTDPSTPGQPEPDDD